LETRKALLVGISFGITGLILLIWVGSFTAGLVGHPTDATLNQKPSPSPFAILKDSAVEMYASVTQGYNAATSK
jgi:hypothetical protein